jgi:transcriptional regulator with XRE-family HTH domain
VAAAAVPPKVNVMNERDFGAIVKARREELGWPQAEITQRCGVSARVVGYLESGRGVTTQTLLGVAGALGLEVVLAFPPRDTELATVADLSAEEFSTDADYERALGWAARAYRAGRSDLAMTINPEEY